LTTIEQRLHAVPYIVLIFKDAWYRYSEHAHRDDAVTAASWLIHSIEGVDPRIGIRLTDDKGQDVIAFADAPDRCVPYAVVPKIDIVSMASGSRGSDTSLPNNAH
jgi:hypothetical protein